MKETGDDHDDRVDPAPVRGTGEDEDLVREVEIGVVEDREAEVERDPNAAARQNDDLQMFPQQVIFTFLLLGYVAHIMYQFISLFVDFFDS